MTDLSSKSVLVRDSGLFVHIAQCLAEKFGKVYYSSPTERVMPKLADAAVGDGFEGIERIDEPMSMIGKVDCWCFTDIGCGEFQNYLTSIGEKVWGHYGADKLETMKGLFLDELEKLGMDVPLYFTSKGISELMYDLHDIEDVYVKISRFRGDMETFHWRSAKLDEAFLDCLAYRLGPAKEKILFYVFNAIDTDVEDGIDTWRVNGKWPKKVLHAMERKDKSLLGAIQDMSSISQEVRGVNEKFGTVLDKYGYQGAFSTEVRLADDKTYFIDPSCRFGSPPSQLQTKLIANLPEVIWGGAHGEVVEPEAPETFGAQVLITADREKDEWLTFDMPSELRPWVKSSFACQIDGVLRIAPNPLENWAGWLVATGNSIEEVIHTLKGYKAMLPDGFDCDLTSLSDLLRELEAAKEHGVEITEQPIPEPATVLENEETR